MTIPEYPPHDPRSEFQPSPIGVPGVYKVTFILCIPGKNAFRENVNIPEIMRSGDSLLQASNEAGEMDVLIANDYTVLFTTNAEGMLATAVVRVQADNFYEAEKFAYDSVMPILSHWSFLNDVALDITGYETEFEPTSAKRWRFGMVGQIKPFQPHGEFISTPEHRRLFAAYCEAMNATNVFYQVLCLFKVAEGIRSLWVRRHRKAGKKGPVVPECNETLPAEFAGLSAADQSQENGFRSLVGEPLVDVLDTYRPLIRDAVAHLQHMDNVLDADRFDDIGKCERAIYVIGYIARRLLLNELATPPPVHIGDGSNSIESQTDTASIRV